MTDARAFLRRIRGRTVWGRAPVEPEDVRMTALERVGYPWADFSLIIFGLGGARYGIPALRDVFNDTYSQGWSAVLAVVAAWCLIGVSFPGRYWRIELVAQLTLVSMLGVYGGALIAAGVLADPDDFGRSAVAFVPLALLGPLGCRVWDLPRQARARARRRQK